MRISDILQDGRVHISFEFFPPRLDAPFEPVMQAIDTVSRMQPAFCSITYGATGGATENTVHIASEVKNRYNIPALAHLTGAELNRERAILLLEHLQQNNIYNILALRGDILPHRAHLRQHDFEYASDLIAFIKWYDRKFCVGAACYPEGHVESSDKTADVRYLKLKQEVGADFLTSQMFFDNNIFYNFMYHLREAGVTIPVVAGIMPIASYEQIAKVVKLSGSSLPQPFLAIADRFRYNRLAFEDAMLSYTCNQIIDLIANGINNIHIYTMNKAKTAERIISALGSVLTL